MNQSRLNLSNSGIGAGHLSFGGGWAFRRSTESTIVSRLNSTEEVALTGELHRALWSAPEQLKAYEALIPSISLIADAAAQIDLDTTVGSVLRGTGWGLLFVELTGRCNERCVHCYASSSPEVTQELAQSSVLGLIDEAASLGFSAIQFTGGDPLLSPHLLAAVERAHVRNIPQIEVYTNGLALKPLLAAALAQYHIKMAFSVYSHRSEVHDAMTQTPGSLERTLQAISWALEAGIEARVGVVLSRDNLGDEEGVVARLATLGVDRDRVSVDRERPVGRGHWNEAAQTAYDESPRVMHSASSREQGSGKLAVTYDGRVVPCIFDRERTLGHIRPGDDSSLRRVLAQRIQMEQQPEAFERRPALRVLSQSLACDDCQARRELLASLRIEG